MATVDVDLGASSAHVNGASLWLEEGKLCFGAGADVKCLENGGEHGVRTDKLAVDGDVTVQGKALFASLEKVEKELADLTAVAVKTTDGEITIQGTKVKETLTHLAGKGEGGASYVRWGRSSCPGDAELVYAGIGVGSYYTHARHTFAERNALFISTWRTGFHS